MSNKTQPLSFDEITKLHKATLEDALRSIESGIRTNTHNADFWEDLDWLFDEGEGPFAFITICKVLAMHPSKIRDRVIRELRKCHIIRVNSLFIDLNEDDNYDLIVDFKYDQTSNKNR